MPVIFSLHSHTSLLLLQDCIEIHVLFRGVESEKKKKTLFMHPSIPPPICYRLVWYSWLLYISLETETCHYVITFSTLASSSDMFTMRLIMKSMILYRVFKPYNYFILIFIEFAISTFEYNLLFVQHQVSFKISFKTFPTLMVSYFMSFLPSQSNKYVEV